MGIVEHDTSHPETPPSPAPIGNLASLKKAGFHTFLTNVVTKVVETGADVADSLQSRLQQPWQREAPPLETVFSKTTTWPSMPGATAPAAAQGKPAAAVAAAERRVLLGEGTSTGDGVGGQPVAGRAAGADGRPRARTAEEVRAAYASKQKRCVWGAALCLPCVSCYWSSTMH